MRGTPDNSYWGTSGANMDLGAARRVAKYHEICKYIYYGRYKIRVNAVCAGGVYDNQGKRFVKNYSRQVPIKRMARTDEISSAIIFLSSEAASYITGSNLVVDGGWTSI